MNEPVRNILWTGGFDSTWLVVDALMTGHRVEAVTYRGNGMPPSWVKTQREDEARRRIVHALPAEMRARLYQWVEEDRSIYGRSLAVWEELCDAQPGFWSPQNMLLANIPRVLRVTLEAGFVAEDLTVKQAPVRTVLENHGIAFPLANLSKHALLDDARRRGFEHLLLKTWSCEGYRDGPCGECEPCKARIVG